MFSRLLGFMSTYVQTISRSQRAQPTMTNVQRDYQLQETKKTTSMQEQHIGDIQYNEVDTKSPPKVCTQVTDGKVRETGLRSAFRDVV